MTEQLLQGFSQTEAGRIKTHLERLLPHLAVEEIIIAGGLAIRFHFTQRGVDFPKRPFNDLDLLAKSLNAVRPSISTDFLISHYHSDPDLIVPGQKFRFYIALVEPVSKTKVDIFDSAAYYPAETIDVHFNDYLLKMQSLEDQLITTVLELSETLKREIAEKKKFQDADLMLKLADRNLLEKTWAKRNPEKVKVPLTEIYSEMKETIAKHPELLIVSRHHRKEPYTCRHCLRLPELPIAPMKKIFEILGYAV